MNIGKVRLDTGRYRVVVDGRETSLVIERGPPPKFGRRQEWHIGRAAGDDVQWLAYDQHGLDAALATVRAILTA